MKKLLLILAIQLIGWKTSFAAVQLYLTGSTSTCPGTTERYEFSTDNEKTFSYKIEVTNGYILEYGNQTGTIKRNQHSTSVTISPYYGSASSQSPYVLVQWTTLIGATGTVTFTAGTTRYTYVDYSDMQLKVAVGSSSITDTVPYSASCDIERIGFSIPEVSGASSYNWQNTLGWSLIQTFNNGGYTYATFSSNGSTATSGQVTVGVINSGCPSTNSTKTFQVTRPAGDHIINGPDVVPPGQYADYTAPDGRNYNWFVSTDNGWRIVSGQGTNHIQVQAPTNNNLQLPIGAVYTDVCGQQQTGSKPVSTQVYEDSFAGAGHTAEQESAKQAVAATIIPEAAIYPNPVADELIISSGGQAGKALIYNSTGALVREIILNTESVRVLVNTRNLPAGSYQVKLKQAGLPAINRQIAIQH